MNVRWDAGDIPYHSRPYNLHSFSGHQHPKPRKSGLNVVAVLDSDVDRTDEILSELKAFSDLSIRSRKNPGPVFDAAVYVLTYNDAYCFLSPGHLPKPVRMIVRRIQKKYLQSLLQDLPETQDRQTSQESLTEILRGLTLLKPHEDGSPMLPDEYGDFLSKSLMPWRKNVAGWSGHGSLDVIARFPMKGIQEGLQTAWERRGLNIDLKYFNGCQMASTSLNLKGPPYAVASQPIVNRGEIQWNTVWEAALRECTSSVPALAKAMIDAIRNRPMSLIDLRKLEELKRALSPLRDWRAMTNFSKPAEKLHDLRSVLWELSAQRGIPPKLRSDIFKALQVLQQTVVYSTSSQHVGAGTGLSIPWNFFNPEEGRNNDGNLQIRA